MTRTSEESDLADEHWCGPAWIRRDGSGPVIATAIHDGHAIRPSLAGNLVVDDATRRREEDPLTGIFARVGDTSVIAQRSRFEFDLNRSREAAITTDPADTWGLRVWGQPFDQFEPNSAAVSRKLYDRFYREMTELVETRLQAHGAVLVLDIHSYNHRRSGAESTGDAPEENPDIDLGVTTLDLDRWDPLVKRLEDGLREVHPGADVRRNVRYPDGGHFPEWLYARYGTPVCALTLEYKKIYIDEWTGQADLDMVDRLHASLSHAVARVRSFFS